jgi:putative transposase
MIEGAALRFLVMACAGWWSDQRQAAVAYLVEENRILHAQLRGRRVRLIDEDRRRLARAGQRVGRRLLRQVATIVTPDTILRWHRQLIAGKWTYAKGRRRRSGVVAEIRRLVARMAEENPTWGYTRIQGALKNVGHRVGRSTIARILKAQGIRPAPERPTSWRVFLRAHCGAIAGADFFTTEVWTWRGLVTYYTVFVIDLASRRAHIVGSRVLICDRDAKWSAPVRARLDEAGIRVVQTPYQAPNANAYAEGFVRSIKHECLNRVIPFGERHLDACGVRRTLPP